MKALVDVGLQEKVTIKRIEGGDEIRRHLNDLDIREGIEIRVLDHKPTHEHRGAISLKVDGEEIVLGRGVADKVYVEKEDRMVPLLELEKGNSGVVKAFGGGKDLLEWVSPLGIEENKEITFLRHLPEDILTFEVDGRSISMGEGRSSKILVESEGKIIQANYLEEGKKGKVNSFTGGVSSREGLEQTDIRESSEIIMRKRKTSTPFPERGKYVLAEVGGNQITIGYGMARKVYVD
jgi:Fe2+ transport system protein FeoA